MVGILRPLFRSGGIPGSPIPFEEIVLWILLGSAFIVALYEEFEYGFT